MSENALRFCLCPELVPLLNEIIVSQKKGHQRNGVPAEKAGLLEIQNVSVVRKIK